MAVPFKETELGHREIRLLMTSQPGRAHVLLGLRFLLVWGAGSQPYHVPQVCVYCVVVTVILQVCLGPLWA